MKHFFNKIIILIFITFTAISVIVTSSNFNVDSNNLKQEELFLNNEITIEKTNYDLKQTPEQLIEPIVRVINADNGTDNGEIYFEWGLVDENREIVEIIFSMIDPSDVLLEKTLDIASITDISKRFSYAFSAGTEDWQTYDKGSLINGSYTNVQMEVCNTEGPINIEYFDDITIEDGAASEPIVMLESDSIIITNPAHIEGETIDLTIDYFYDDVNDNVIPDDFEITEFTICARELNNPSIIIETIIDPTSLQANFIETATMIGLKPEIEYEFYILYRWNSTGHNPYEDNIVTLDKPYTPKYYDVTEPKITNIEARNIKPEDIAPEGGLKNGEVEVMWEIEDIHNSITGITVELESITNDQHSQTSDLLPKEARDYIFTNLEVGSFEAMVKIDYIANVGIQELIEKSSSMANTSIATKEVPGVKHDPSKDVYSERNETLTMHLEIDNRFGLIEKNKHTLFNLYDSNGEHVDHKAVHNSPNAAGEFEAKIYEFQLNFFDIPPGEYSLEVIIQLTSPNKPYTIILDAQEYSAPESFVALIIILTTGSLILFAIICYLIYRVYRSRKIWKTDSVEKSINETPKKLKIELELLSLTKVLDQVSISILDDDKNYKEVASDDNDFEKNEDLEKKELLTGREILKIPNIILNEDHDYKHMILLPTLKYSAKINIVTPKKRIRNASPPCWTKPDHQGHILNVKPEDGTTEITSSNYDVKKRLKYDKDGQGHYLTIGEGIKTKYIKGGKYELHIIYSSNVNKDENLSLKRELLTNIVITFRKLS